MILLGTLKPLVPWLHVEGCNVRSGFAPANHRSPTASPRVGELPAHWST